jgi:hypothetical protein
MDEIIKETKGADRAYRMGGREVEVLLCYADDAMIISKDEDDMQRLEMTQLRNDSGKV